MLNAPNQPYGTSQLGKLIGDYPGSPRRYLDIVMGCLLLAFAYTNATGAFGFYVDFYGTGQAVSTIFFALCGGYAFVDFYINQRGAHARVYEHGFAITRGDTTTSYPWENIAAIQHWVRTQRLFYFIPISRSRYAVVVMKGGQKIELAPWLFSNANILDQTIQRMWKQAPVWQQAMPSAATAIPAYPAPPLPAPTAVPQIAASASPPPLGTPGVIQWGSDTLPPPSLLPPDAPPSGMPPAATLPPVDAPPVVPPPGIPLPDALTSFSAPADPFAQAIATVAPTPSAPPSSRVQYTDIAVGAGPVAQAGQRVSIHYTGWLTNGMKFDSSIDRGPPLQFVLGSGEVLAGLDQGVVGMRVGGKRRLTIPPELAYGAAGAGDAIPPGATLIFEIDLMSAL